jgi:two-component system response regulator
MSQLLKIIVVDDDEDDKQLLQHAIKEAGIANPVVYLEGGEQLLEFLNTPESENIGFILLDLNMPVMDGREVLRVMKLNTVWRKVPIIIFSTSDNHEDVRQAYGLGAVSYITKPLSFVKLVSVMKAVKDFWFESATLPV